MHSELKLENYGRVTGGYADVAHGTCLGGTKPPLKAARIGRSSGLDQGVLGCAAAIMSEVRHTRQC